MLQPWEGFAIGTEVSVVTDSALVADATDVLLASLASTSSSVAPDAEVGGFFESRLLDFLVEFGKAMARMDLRSTLDTGLAVVPVGAAQALVTNTTDMLYKLVLTLDR